MAWIVETLNATVDAEIERLPADMRAICVTAIGQRVVILRAFVKKSAKTPARELDLALARSKEVR
jgi:phage-related protein